MQTKKGALVILTPGFPANESEENWIPFQQSLLRSIKKLFPGTRIFVLSFIYPHAVSMYQWYGIDVFSFNGSEYKKIKRPLLWRNVWRKLKTIHEEYGIAAILSLWCGECSLVGRYFAKRNAVKHFTWICGQDARKSNRLVKFIRPAPGELIAMSDFLVGEFYTNHHIKPAHMIPGGVDRSLYIENKLARDIDIIGAGSLTGLKQYDIFVDIVAGLRKQLPGIKTVICGDGEEAVKLKRMRRDLSLEKNLQLPGMLRPGETITMMQRSKLFLHPSSYEGFCMACYEALYAGAHVISFVKTSNHEIRHWHVVKSKEEMQEKAFELLRDNATTYESVSTYVMDDSATAMMKLFGFS